MPDSSSVCLTVSVLYDLFTKSRGVEKETKLV